MSKALFSSVEEKFKLRRGQANAFASLKSKELRDIFISECDVHFIMLLRHIIYLIIKKSYGNSKWYLPYLTNIITQSSPNATRGEIILADKKTNGKFTGMLAKIIIHIEKTITS